MTTEQIKVHKNAAYTLNKVVIWSISDQKKKPNKLAYFIKLCYFIV